MRDRLPPSWSPHRPAGIRLRAWQPGAFPAGPGPLSPAATGPRPGSIRTAPRGLPRSPPRRQRTTACRTFFVMSELQPMPLTCADTAPDSWSLPASLPGGSDSRITRSARTLVQNWTLSSWLEDRRLARPFGLAGRLEPRAGRASHYPNAGARRRQPPIRDTATSSTWIVLAAVTKSRRPSQRCTPSGYVARLTGMARPEYAKTK